jgi:hypothetical protein
MPIIGSMGALTSQKNYPIIIPGSRRFGTLVGPGSPVFLTANSSIPANLTATSGYTLEHWIWYLSPTFTSASNPLSVGSFTPGFSLLWYLQVTGAGAVRFYWYAGSPVVTYFVTTTTGLVTAGGWNSVAMVISNSGSTSTIQLFLNGTIRNIRLNNVGTYTPSYAIPSSQLTPGATLTYSPPANTDSQECYLDEVRVSDIARYTANYTPATSQFTPDNNTNLLWHMPYNTAIGATSPVIDSSKNNISAIVGVARPTTAVSSPAKF